MFVCELNVGCGSESGTLRDKKCCSGKVEIVELVVEVEWTGARSARFRTFLDGLLKMFEIFLCLSSLHDPHRHLGAHKSQQEY